MEPQRPRISLKPRTLPLDSPSPSPTGGQDNIFGAARPREAIMAERNGANEIDIIKENAKAEYNVQIRLSLEQQAQQKNAVEIRDAVKAKLEDPALNPAEIETLKADLDAKQRDLDELSASFEDLAVQQAREGRSRRDRSAEQQQQQAHGHGERSYGGRGKGYSKGEGKGGYDHGGKGQANDEDDHSRARYHPTRGGYEQRSGFGGYQPTRGGAVEGRDLGDGSWARGGEERSGYQSRGGYQEKGGKGGRHYHQDRNGGKGGQYHGKGGGHWSQEDPHHGGSSHKGNRHGGFSDRYSNGKGYQQEGNEFFASQRDHRGGGRVWAGGSSGGGGYEKPYSALVGHSALVDSGPPAPYSALVGDNNAGGAYGVNGYGADFPPSSLMAPNPPSTFSGGYSTRDAGFGGSSTGYALFPSGGELDEVFSSGPPSGGGNGGGRKGGGNRGRGKGRGKGKQQDGTSYPNPGRGGGLEALLSQAQGDIYGDR
ncbi:hypothetical protein CYMTET_41284 [Cymbomonas tetramitiformis]|uniref:Uncharacterized protein n=1 Tax=Cymbomonas tetramitiformis TaxID=36881 RepID=A0AAE0C6D5_9CHLO|nr:hypothetical protein CYMTET_41284 [Cymbomonas tetramitiformis]